MYISQPFPPLFVCPPELARAQSCASKYVDSTFFTTLPRRELRGFYIKRVQDEMARQESVDEEELEKVRRLHGKGRRHPKYGSLRYGVEHM